MKGADIVGALITSETVGKFTSSMSKTLPGLVHTGTSNTSIISERVSGRLTHHVGEKAK
jgi:hypothetical protein